MKLYDRGAGILYKISANRAVQLTRWRTPTCSLDTLPDRV